MDTTQELMEAQDLPYNVFAKACPSRVTLEHVGWEGLPPEKLWLIEEHDRGWLQLLAPRLKKQVEDA